MTLVENFVYTLYGYYLVNNIYCWACAVNKETRCSSACMIEFAFFNPERVYLCAHIWKYMHRIIIILNFLFGFDNIILIKSKHIFGKIFVRESRTSACFEIPSRQFYYYSVVVVVLKTIFFDFSSINLLHLCRLHYERLHFRHIPLCFICNMFR